MDEPLITVLGGRGFIGSNLAAYLRNNGYRCQVPDRDDNTIFSRPLGRIVYAIGLTADFRSRPLATVEAHVCLLRKLIDHGDFDSLTYLSSTRVYAGVSDTRESASLTVNPNDAGDLYNLSKLMGESLCLHGGRSGMNVARLSNIVGIRPDPDIFIDQLLEEGRKTGKVLLRTALDSRKDYLYISDAVHLIARLALSDETGIYNVASGEGVSNGEVVQALTAELGYEVSVAEGAPVWDFTAIDVSKAKARFGFAPLRFSNYFPAFLSDYRRKHLGMAGRA